MDLTLRAMRVEEFDGYLAYFIPDYAAEISSNYGLSPNDAQAKAMREIAEDLPQGPATPDHNLLCITLGAEIIGYFWYRSDQKTRSVFIYDFCILELHQRKGHGKNALASFETMLAKDGFEQIKLRVAADNKRAQDLYLKDGFRATGINMERRISPD